MERDRARLVGQLARSSRYIAVERQLDGPGLNSLLVVIRHDSVDAPGYVRIAPVSDEVRIYDEMGDGLQLVFRFRPGSERGRPYSGQSPRSDERLPFIFELSAVVDLDDDGSPEVIGSYASLFMVPSLPRPVVINRPVSGHPFRIQPLTAFQGPPRQSRGVWARNQRGYYRWSSVLSDPRTNVEFQAHPAEAVTFLANDAILVETYVVGSRCHACRAELFSRFERVGIAEGGRVATYTCPVPHALSTQITSGHTLVYRELAVSAWRHIKRGQSADDVCPVPDYF